MKIAIDISPLQMGHKFRGIGVYTQNLIDSLQSIKVPNFSLQLIKEGRTPSDVDLVHYPYFDLFFLTLPLFKPKPTIVTIHDVIPLVFPDKFPKGMRGWFKLQAQKFSLKGVSAVITDSQKSKKDIIEYLGFPEKKISVVPLTPSKDFKPIINCRLLITVKKKYQLPDKFVLYVGDVNWNKNVPGLIKAFNKLKVQNLKLVLVGKAFADKNLKETKLIFQLIKELNLIDQTKILGFTPTEDLVAIYNLATVYCQPSFYEGFGLPVLEAMVCGCPVVATRTSSLPEIGNEAVVWVNPYKPANIAEGLEKVLNYHTTEYEKYEELRKKGLRQARKFSWQRTAQATIKVYEKVVLRS